MKSIDPASNSDSTPNQTTRRNFMKKSALTVGAVTVLSQGTAVAGFWDVVNGIRVWISNHVSIVPISGGAGIQVSGSF